MNATMSGNLFCGYIEKIAFIYGQIAMVTRAFHLFQERNSRKLVVIFCESFEMGVIIIDIQLDSLEATRILDCLRQGWQSQAKPDSVI